MLTRGANEIESRIISDHFNYLKRLTDDGVVILGIDDEGHIRGLRGDFKSKEDLGTKLIQFIEEYNKEAKPFAWTYKGRPLMIG